MNGNRHIPMIDYMKGVCALWVIMLHTIFGGGYCISFF